MKVRSVALWAALGVAVSSAAALAIPMPPGAKGGTSTVLADPNGKPLDAQDVNHFTAGQTLTIDGRLGHATLAKNGAGETFLFTSVTGTDAASASAAPLNLAIVIDRSGSMKGDRIANAITAAVGMVERMRDGDTVTVVSFDTEAQVVVSPTRTTPGTRPTIESAIRAIRLGGDTCISCGLDAAMVQLNQTSLGGGRRALGDEVRSAPESVNRMILLSDGATNHGIRDIGGLRALAGRMRDRGCSISTVGVDVDFDEKVMAAIASESNGRHYFVANPSGLPAIFAQEFDSLLASIATGTELAVDLAPGVEVEQVFDRTFRREGNRIIVPFGTFSAKQEKTVLIKLRVPADREGMQPVADVKLTYRDLVQKSDGAAVGALALMVTTDGAAQTDLDPFVAARLERSKTAQTLTEANLLFENGRGAEARDKLAAQSKELAKSEVVARSFAARNRPAAAAPRNSRGVDDDFNQQRAAVAQAEASFAPPPPAKGGSIGGFGSGGSNASPFATGTAATAPSPAQQDTREGKAARKTNQSNASDFGL